MRIDKSILAAMIASDGKFWIKDVLEYQDRRPMMQVTLVAKERNHAEPFPGVTAEVHRFVCSDDVDCILSVIMDKDKRVVTVKMTEPESTHTEDTA